MTVDMNAVRAARKEALGEGPEIVIGNQRFRCKPDLPWDALVAISRLQNDNEAEGGFDFVREVAGSEAVKALRDWKPSVHEMNELTNGVLEELGIRERTSPNGAKADGEGDAGEVST